MQFGNIQLDLISDGLFRLDGGAMFGVVPKVLWQKLKPADEANRILMGLNSLLIRTGEATVLVDTGIGDKFDARFAQMFAIDREKTLIDGLAEKGVTPEQVTHVIMTHMHFDHIGWNTRRNAGGEVVPTFTNAVYYAQRGEFDVANAPDPRSRASYLAENWQPLERSGQLELVEGSRELLPGIRCVVTGGHTANHTIITIETGGKKACFLADLVPTPAHLKTPWVMGYDLYPVDTMRLKDEILRQAAEENWLLFFEHEPEQRAGYLRIDGKNRELDGVEV